MSNQINVMPIKPNKVNMKPYKANDKTGLCWTKMSKKVNVKQN